MADSAFCDVRERAREQKMACALLRDPAADRSIDRIVAFAARFLRCPLAFLQVRTADGGDVVKTAVGPIPPQPAVNLLEALSAEPVEITDTAADLRVSAPAGVRSLLAVPLMDDGAVVAALAVADGVPRRWTTQEVVTLGEFAELVVSTAAEVRARRNTTRALEFSEHRYRALIEHTAEGMWCCEFAEAISTALPASEQIALAYERGTLVECNDAIASMYGLPRSTDLIGASLADLLAPSVPGNVEMLHAFATSGYRLNDLESQETDLAGATRHFLNALIGIVEDGALVRIWGIRQDITERRRLEEQLRQAQKMEAVGRLAGGVAHDFNNLLTAIQGHADLALDGLINGENIADELEEIRRASTRATSLTRQLLAFSRKQVLRPRVLDLNGIVSQMERMLRRLIGEHIDLTTSFAADLGRIRADAGQIEQVILNLAVNARDAMTAGGTLAIETRDIVLDEPLGRRSGLAAGRYARLTVRDTGEGMSRDTLARIFEPFFTTKSAGTGLGLATVYGIVEQSGGTVTAYSEIGRGTIFEVYLPVVEAAEPAAAAVVAEAAATGGAETVLLVEDEAGVRAVARKTLRMKGYHVLEAEGGRAALDLAATCPGTIDLLLTDVVMPGMAGTELAAQLAALRPALRVLYMSGYTDDEVFRAASPLGGTAFIEKPFTPDRLARAVRAALDGRAIPNAAAEELA